MSVQLIKRVKVDLEGGKESERFVLNEDALKSVLETAKSQDMPLAIISIGPVINMLVTNSLSKIPDNDRE